MPWIKELINHLEEFRGFKLYIPERNMLVGCLRGEEIHWIADKRYKFVGSGKCQTSVLRVTKMHVLCSAGTGKKCGDPGMSTVTVQS